MEDVHFHLGTDKDKGSIGNGILIVEGIDELVIDVKDRRNAHLVALVGLIIPEGAVSILRVRHVTEGDVERIHATSTRIYKCSVGDVVKIASTAWGLTRVQREAT